MRFCFIDESGTPPNKPNPPRPYFTLGAVIIDAANWSHCHKAVHGFKVRSGIRGEVKWRFFSPHNRDKDNPLLAAEPDARKKLSLEFATLISKLPVTIIACVTDVEAAYGYAIVTNQSELYHFTYKPITERFQYHLQDVSDCGIVVADHRGRTDDKMLRTHHATLTSSASGNNSGYDRLIEGLFLQDSAHSTGIQLADYVTGALHRAYSANDGEHASYFKSRIRTNKQGSISGHGIVLHPKSTFKHKR